MLQQMPIREPVSEHWSVEVGELTDKRVDVSPGSISNLLQDQSNACQPCVNIFDVD